MVWGSCSEQPSFLLGRGVAALVLLAAGTPVGGSPSLPEKSTLIRWAGGPVSNSGHQIRDAAVLTAGYVYLTFFKLNPKSFPSLLSDTSAP